MPEPPLPRWFVREAADSRHEIQPFSAALIGGVLDERSKHFVPALVLPAEEGNILGSTATSRVVGAEIPEMGVVRRIVVVGSHDDLASPGEYQWRCERIFKLKVIIIVRH